VQEENMSARKKLAKGNGPLGFTWEREKN